MENGAVVNLLSSSNYRIFNIDLARLVGTEGAVLIGELCSRYTYYESYGGLTEDGYFFATIEDIEQNTGLTRRRQDSTLCILKEMGFVDIKVKGMPAKRYIKLNSVELSQALTNLFVRKRQTGLYENAKQVCTKTPRIISSLSIKETSSNNNTKDKTKYIQSHNETRQTGNGLKTKYGEYKHVLLTDEQYKQLKELYKDELPEHIKYYDEYMEQKPKYTNDNHYLAIKGWVHKAYLQSNSICIPTLEEVKAEVIEQGYTNTEPERFYYKMQALGWCVNGNPVKDWKALLKAWALKPLKEGKRIAKLLSENESEKDTSMSKAIVNEYKEKLMGMNKEELEEYADKSSLKEEDVETMEELSERLKAVTGKNLSEFKPVKCRREKIERLSKNELIEKLIMTKRKEVNL